MVEPNNNKNGFSGLDDLLDIPAPDQPTKAPNPRRTTEKVTPTQTSPKNQRDDEGLESINEDTPQVALTEAQRAKLRVLFKKIADNSNGLKELANDVLLLTGGALSVEQAQKAAHGVWIKVVFYEVSKINDMTAEEKAITQMLLQSYPKLLTFEQSRQIYYVIKAKGLAFLELPQGQSQQKPSTQQSQPKTGSWTQRLVVFCATLIILFFAVYSIKGKNSVEDVPISEESQAFVATADELKDMTMVRFRLKYPEYSDLNDDDLAERIHKKFFSNQKYEDFIAWFNTITHKKPSLGDVVDGYIFKGGDTGDKENWTPLIASQLKLGDLIDGHIFLGGNPSSKNSWARNVPKSEMPSSETSNPHERYIEINEIGLVRFPDSMTNQEIADAIVKEIYPKYRNDNPSASPDDVEATAPAAAPEASDWRTSTPNGNSWPTSTGYLKGFPKLHTDGLSNLTIDNSQNSSDVHVKLFYLDDSGGEDIRNAFIKAGSSFTMKKIRKGNYDVRYRDLSDGGLSKSEQFELQEVSMADGIQYSEMRMTLYKVANGNMQTQSISESQF